MSEIVSGKLWAAERIDDGGAVNLAPTDAPGATEALREVLGYTGHNPRIEFHPEMATRPVNRMTDNLLAKKKFGWEAQLALMDSLRRTVEWYFARKEVLQVRGVFESLLMERRAAPQVTTTLGERHARR